MNSKSRSVITGTAGSVKKSRSLPWRDFLSLGISGLNEGELAAIVTASELGALSRVKEALKAKTPISSGDRKAVKALIGRFVASDHPVWADGGVQKRDRTDGLARAGRSGTKARRLDEACRKLYPLPKSGLKGLDASEVRQRIRVGVTPDQSLEDAFVRMRIRLGITSGTIVVRVGERVETKGDSRSVRLSDRARLKEIIRERGVKVTRSKPEQEQLREACLALSYPKPPLSADDREIVDREGIRLGVSKGTIVVKIVHPATENGDSEVLREQDESKILQYARRMASKQKDQNTRHRRTRAVLHGSELEDPELEHEEGDTGNEEETAGHDELDQGHVGPLQRSTPVTVGDIVGLPQGDLDNADMEAATTAG